MPIRTRSLLPILAALAALVLPSVSVGAADPSPSGDGWALTVAGTIVLPDGATTPVDAVVRVEVQDTSLADAPAVTVATLTMTAPGVGSPIPFALSVLAEALDARVDHTLSVRIEAADGRLLFVNDTAIAAIVGGQPRTDVVAPVVAVGGDPEPAPSPARSPIEGVQWILVALGAGGTAGEPGPVPDVLTPSLWLEDGVASGRLACNRFVSQYVLEGSSLEFGLTGTTGMACASVGAAFERAYLDALANVGAWSLPTGGPDALWLLDAAGSTLLEYRRAPEPSVVGSWVAAAVNNDVGGVESVIVGAEPTADFGEDGTLSGSDGCEPIAGTWTTSGETIVIELGPTGVTATVCEGTVRAQAAAYRTALVRASSYAVREDGGLELRDAGGALQVLFVPGAAS